MRLAVLLVLCASACGDNLSVVVDVTHPSPVAKTVISVYESDAVDCTKIEFGDIGAATLAATLVAEETHLADGTVTGDLDGLSRTADKSIVARGYDANDELVTAGCTTKGVVHGRDHVAVDTVPAMIISVVSEVSADPDKMPPTPYVITALATRTDGVPLPKREVSWQVYAPTGSAPVPASLATIAGESEWQPINAACTNGNGIARLHPIPPSYIGGFATRIRASWAANALPFETELAPANLKGLLMLAPDAGVKHACAVKIAGSVRRLICLDKQGASSVAREYSMTLAPGTGKATLNPMGTETLTSTPVGVFAKPASASGDQNVYVVDDKGDQTPVFGAPAVAKTLCPLCAVTDFLFVPACAAPENDAKLFLQENTGIRVMSASGGGTLALPNFAENTSIRLKGAGCVDQLTPQSNKLQRQVLVADVTVPATVGTQTITRALYACDAGGCSKVVLPVAGTGVGFVTTTTGEHRLVGPSLDATGLVMSSWVIRALVDSTDRTDILLERDRLPAAQTPHELVIGKVDDDDGYDLIWDIQTTRGTTLELAYSRMAGDQRLEVVASMAAIMTDELQLEDLDGQVDQNGQRHPELIVIGIPGSGTGGTTPVAVIAPHADPVMTPTAPEECK